jgi:hypothetical protein
MIQRMGDVFFKQGEIGILHIVTKTSLNKVMTFIF